MGPLTACLFLSSRNDRQMLLGWRQERRERGGNFHAWVLLVGHRTASSLSPPLATDACHPQSQNVHLSIFPVEERLARGTGADISRGSRKRSLESAWPGIQGRAGHTKAFGDHRPTPAISSQYHSKSSNAECECHAELCVELQRTVLS